MPAGEDIQRPQFSTPPIKRQIKWFRNGLRERIPLCCILRFCVPPYDTFSRGVCSNRHGDFVACGIFHRGRPVHQVAAEKAMWQARDCLRSYLKYGDWDEHAEYGTQAAFDALSEVLIPE